MILHPTATNQLQQTVQAIGGQRYERSELAPYGGYFAKHDGKIEKQG